MWRLEFLSSRGLPRISAVNAIWAPVLAVAALFVSWELLTHFQVHTAITSNRAIFMVIVVAVGLVGSALIGFFFSRMGRTSVEALGSKGGASVRESTPVAFRDVAAEAPSLPESQAITRSILAVGDIGRLKWMAILAPAGLFVGWESLTHFVLHRLLISEKIVFLVTIGAIAFGATLFTQFLFRLLRRMQRQLVHQNRELVSRTTALEALYEIGTGLSALQEVGTIKATTVGKARQLLDADTAGLALLHEATGEVRWELMAKATGEEFRSLRLPLGHCVGGQAIQSGEPVIIEDVARGPDPSLTTRPLMVGEDLRAVLVVPIRIAGKPVGALMVGHRTPYSFHLNDLKLLMSLANQAAVAINNAHLYERLGALSAVEERERLAREMHDGLAQLLGNATARAGAASELLNQGDATGALRQLDRLRHVTQEAYIEVRQSILGLRTRPLGKRGLLEALGEFVRRFAEQEGTPVHLEAMGSTEALDMAPDVEVQAIRIIQEALSNVRKHSEAGQAWVKLRSDPRWLTIIIQDNGRGFEPGRKNGKGSHFGLTTMRERAELVGGSLAIETAPGKGTAVTVVLPVGEGT